MATPTYDPIASTTLTSSASSVTFSSLDTIAAGYRDLVLVVDGNTILTSGMSLQLNGDSGSNYNYVQMLGNGSSASSQSGTDTSARVANSNGTQTVGIAHIMDYAATDKHTSILSRGDCAAASTRAHAVRWANTAAVTSVTLVGTSANLASGTTVSLFGIVA